MKYLGSNVSLQEVPGEISLIFQISNCPHKCHGCHSSELWSDTGIELSLEKFCHELARYDHLITCICFFGGEWDEVNLIMFLRHARDCGYKTCLYTGSETVSKKLLNQLNYLKTGPWKEEFGGLNSQSTNQKFTNLDSGVSLNHIFQNTQGESHVKVNGRANHGEN